MHDACTELETATLPSTSRLAAPDPVMAAMKRTAAMKKAGAMKKAAMKGGAMKAAMKKAKKVGSVMKKAAMRRAMKKAKAAPEAGGRSTVAGRCGYSAGHGQGFFEAGGAGLRGPALLYIAWLVSVACASLAKGA